MGCQSMAKPVHRGRLRAILAVLCVGLATACGSIYDVGGGKRSGPGEVGATVPMLTTPFWQAYSGYLPEKAAEEHVRTLSTLSADNDAAKLITHMNNLLNQGVHGLVVTPVDSAAVVPGIKAAQRRGVPVVAVDVRPEGGKVAMVVRSNNRGYGVKACREIGKRVRPEAGGTAKVVQIQGDLSSVNGRDRSEAFDDCMRRNHPDIKVLNVPADWDADKASSQLEGLLTSNPDVKGIYMQAGGVYLASTLQVLRRKEMLHPAGQPGHVVVVSNDGISQELQAIRKGYLDATVSQPADSYAQYGMYWVRKAMAGQPIKAGPTDHHSTVVEVAPGMLEDQLPAPVVTRANVDDPSLWGNR